MVNQTREQELEYKPSFAARIAKVLIPLMQVILPTKVYKVMYDFLYENYKRSLRGGYWLQVIWTHLVGSPEDKLRVSLTRQLLRYSMGGRKALENAFNITSRVEAKGIEGALVECGVAEGGTAAMMGLANRYIGSSLRQKWFFDSYEGLPEPTEEDYQNGVTGCFVRPLPKGSCLGTIEQVSELMFDKLQFSREETHLVKGWFQDTVPQSKGEVGPISVLRLDGDWYESTKIPLDHLYDQITVGGYVIVDDYGTCFGSKKAVEEFREERNISSPLYSDGRGGVWFEKIETA